jgi:hypothetical protein
MNTRAAAGQKNNRLATITIKPIKPNKKRKFRAAVDDGKAWGEDPPVVRFLKRVKHAAHFRENERLRNATDKQNVERIKKKVAVQLVGQLVGPKISSSTFQRLVSAATKRNDVDVELLHQLCGAFTHGVKPLFDDTDLSILRFWDGFEFLPPFFKIVAHGRTMSELFVTANTPDVTGEMLDAVTILKMFIPGLAKWRDAAAAAFIRFIEGRSDLCSEYAKATKDHPHRRQYQTYKSRRKRLGLRPHKKPIITAAKYDSGADILIITKRLGGDVEIHRFVPTTIQHD